MLFEWRCRKIKLLILMPVSFIEIRRMFATSVLWKVSYVSLHTDEQLHESQQLSPAGDTPETVPANSVTGQLQLIFAMLQFSNRK